MRWFYGLAIGTCLMACTASPSSTPPSETEAPDSTLSATPQPDSLPTVFGQSIAGDFDGDGSRERLQVVVRSGRTGALLEPQAPPPAQRDSLVAHHQPSTCLEIEGGGWPTATLATPETPHWGVSYLKWEGDLDGDGGDELSYVVNWADASALTTLHVLSYKAGAWTMLHTQTIRGNSLPRSAEEAAPPFITALKEGWIRSYCLNDEALMEYRFVNLTTNIQWPKASRAVDSRFIEVGDSISLPQLLVLVEYEEGLETYLNKQGLSLSVKATFYKASKTDGLVYNYPKLDLIMMLYNLQGKWAKQDFFDLADPDMQLELSVEAVKKDTRVALTHHLPATTFKALLANPPTLKLSRPE